jgi:hypothetical protein
MALMTQIRVKVRNITKDDTGHPTELYGTETIITYKAFQYLTDKYELIYQVDGEDNEVPGNPNLHPEYRTAVQQKSAVAPVADVRVNASQEQTQKAATKRGPKPKNKANTQEPIENVA